MQQSVFMHVFSKPRAFRNCRLSDRLHHCVAAGQLQMRQIKRDESQVVGVCCLSNVWGKSGRIYCSIFTMAGFWKTARNEWKVGAAITNSPYHPEIPSSIPGWCWSPLQLGAYWEPIDEFSQSGGMEINQCNTKTLPMCNKRDMVCQWLEWKNWPDSHCALTSTQLINFGMNWDADCNPNLLFLWLMSTNPHSHAAKSSGKPSQEG